MWCTDTAVLRLLQKAYSPRPESEALQGEPHCVLRVLPSSVCRLQRCSVPQCSNGILNTPNILRCKEHPIRAPSLQAVPVAQAVLQAHPQQQQAGMPSRSFGMYNALQQRAHSLPTANPTATAQQVTRTQSYQGVPTVPLNQQ